MDQWLDYIRGKLGGNAVGIILTLVAGGALFYYATSFFITAESFSHAREDLICQMTQGDIRNNIEIIEIKLDAVRTEKMKLQNFIDISQDGKCTDTQKIRIEELNNLITELTIKKESLYREALKAR